MVILACGERESVLAPALACGGALKERPPKRERVAPAEAKT